MATPMAPNYANLLKDNFEQNLHCVIIFKTLNYQLCYGFVLFTIFSSDEIGSKDSLSHFISFTQNCSKSKNMKSKTKFKINLSTNEVHFFNVTVSLKHGKLRAALFTKTKDSHFCLNTSSCHPSHVFQNIPKGQFIRLLHICLQKWDYLLNSKI